MILIFRKRTSRRQLLERIAELEAHVEILEHLIRKTEEHASQQVKYTELLRRMK